MAKERVEMTPSEIVQALDKYIIGLRSRLLRSLINIS